MGAKVPCEVSIDGGPFRRFNSFHHAEKHTGISAAYLSYICDKDFKFRKSKNSRNIVCRRVENDVRLLDKTLT